MTISTEQDNRDTHGATMTESPFAEFVELAEAEPVGLIPWTDQFSPFAEPGGGVVSTGSEADLALAELFEALRDEEFNEVITELASETAEAADDRVSAETGIGLLSERERLAEAHLSPVIFEAERYLERLAEGISTVDLRSLSETELDELLDRFDPTGVNLSPASEEFIGGLIRKAKRVVRNAVSLAGRVAKAALPIINPVIGPILSRLKSLIRPLLRRVLAVAIGQLPAPLQAPARAVAARLGLSESAGETDEAELQGASPVAAGDLEGIVEEFDSALAEAVVYSGAIAEQGETFGYERPDEEQAEAGDSGITGLTEARVNLMRQIAAASGPEELEPAIQQFIPALLPALKLGVSLIGRPKVVSFLARFLAQMIGRWVGPNLAGPLSSAIVDVGLRLMTLEQSEDTDREETAQALLATTVEDTVRALSEQQDFVFEERGLLEAAVAEAFENAVAVNFPAHLVRPELQIAPSLGGSFIPMHPRQVFAYKKYSLTPEVEITGSLAQAINSFGGVSLFAALRASGRGTPMKARIHIYEATPGTTLSRIARLERVPGLGRGTRSAWRQIHPLTREAATALLREPRLGAAVPARFLRSRHRIAVGQRFYYLEPLDGAVLPPSRGGRRPTPTPGPRAGITCEHPTQSFGRIDLIRSEIAVALYFSEADAQSISRAMGEGRSVSALLRAMTSAVEGVGRSLDNPNGSIRIIKELDEDEQFLGPVVRRIAPIVLGWLRRKLVEWLMRKLHEWAQARAEEFSRAAQNSACGVTVTVTLRNVPGLNLVRRALNGQMTPADLTTLRPLTVFGGMPVGSVSVVAGRKIA